MGACAKCGGWKPDNCNAGYRNQVCASCQRQDALIAAQRKAILESTPEGREQLARERKRGFIKSLAVLIIVGLAALFVKNEEVKTDDSSANAIKNRSNETNTSTSSIYQTRQINTNRRQMRFVVFNISEGDFLNVRDKPNGSGKIVLKLTSGKIVESQGQMEVKGRDTWVYISTPQGSGWVNGRFIKNIQ